MEKITCKDFLEGCQFDDTWDMPTSMDEFISSPKVGGYYEKRATVIITTADGEEYEITDPQNIQVKYPVSEVIIMQCKFEKAWVGQCKNDAVKGADYCNEHLGKTCVSCGAQATHECCETGQFVCGCDLCDDCTHNTHPMGHNGGIGFNAVEFPEGMKTHCKKSEQKYAPWYVDEETLPLWKKENGIPADVEISLTNNG